MASRKLARLSMLLPTVVGLSLSFSGPTNAYQIEASDYASRLAAALAAKQYNAVSTATDHLRRCGVESIVVDGRATSLAEIDALVSSMLSGGGGDFAGFQGSGASFIVGSIGQSSVECDVDFRESPSLTADNGATNPSST